VSSLVFEACLAGGVVGFGLLCAILGTVELVWGRRR